MFYNQILREARSLKTWQSSRTAQDNVNVEDEGSFSNLTEEGSMEDDSLQDLPRVGLYEEDEDEEHEVVNEEAEESQGDEEKLRFYYHFGSGCKQRMVEGRIQKWQNSIAHSCTRSLP